MKTKKSSTGHGKDMPPTLKHVRIYFDQKGQSTEAANTFFKHYESRKWTTGKGCPILDWKAAAGNWIWQHRPEKPLTLELKIKLQFLNKTL